MLLEICIITARDSLGKATISEFPRYSERWRYFGSTTLRFRQHF